MFYRFKVYALIVSVFLAVVSTAFSDSRLIFGTVIAVHDGDSITVLQDGRPYKVRLAYIDCPELNQPFGQQAKTFTKNFTSSQGSLRDDDVMVDVVGKDRYGRYLGIVYVRGVELNATLVHQGLAWWYRRYAANFKMYQTLEERAREAKRGLWLEPFPIAPWDWRRTSRPHD